MVALGGRLFLMGELPFYSQTYLIASPTLGAQFAIEDHPSLDRSSGGGPRGVPVSYERGAPVPLYSQTCLIASPTAQFAIEDHPSLDKSSDGRGGYHRGRCVLSFFFFLFWGGVQGLGV